jgi:integrase
MSAHRRHEGIEVRHESACPSKGGGRCSCSPSYRAKVYDGRSERCIKKTFRSLAEAKAWRIDALADIRAGTLSGAPVPTLAEAADAWVTRARSGAIRNRSGDIYKPSAVRGYEQALRLRVLPELGRLRLSDVRRADLQGFVDRLLSDGHDPSTIRNTLMPVRAISRRALARGEVAINPTTGLELPAVRGRRDRIASPDEAARLLASLDRDRALWATAMYAGLRLGELLVAPKSRAGVRSVPVAQTLRAYLAEHRLACPWSDGLVFGRSPERPFLAKTPNDRAQRTWRRAGLAPIGLHECRHTFASFMIAAGVNAKALSVYMGHSSVTITFDRYGHLMPGNESEAARLLDAYLRQSSA